MNWGFLNLLTGMLFGRYSLEMSTLQAESEAYTKRSIDITFRLLDEDDEGYIHVHKLTEFTAELCNLYFVNATNPTEQEWRIFFSHLDSNDDGRISKNEFKRIEPAKVMKTFALQRMKKRRFLRYMNAMQFSELYKHIMGGTNNESEVTQNFEETSQAREYLSSNDEKLLNDAKIYCDITADTTLLEYHREFKSELNVSNSHHLSTVSDAIIMYIIDWKWFDLLVDCVLLGLAIPCLIYFNDSFILPYVIISCFFSTCNMLVFRLQEWKNRKIRAEFFCSFSVLLLYIFGGVHHSNLGFLIRKCKL